MTKTIAGREVLPDGALGLKTSLHIATVQVVGPAPSNENACIVRRLGDETEYMVDEPEEKVTDRRRAVIDRKYADMEARFGRQFTRF